MNNKTKTILIILVVIGVLLFAAFAPTKKAYTKISYEEYQKLDKPSIVYIGNDSSVLDVFKDMDIDDYSILFLKHSKLDKKAKAKVKKDVIELWNDGKLRDTYNLDKYLLKEGDKSATLNNVTIDEYLKLKDAKGFNFMFIGRETCGYCVKFKDAIKEFHKEYKVDINYIDTDTLNEAAFQKLTATDDYLSSEQWGTPTSFVYYNGNKIDMISGYIDENQLKEKMNTYGIQMFLMDNEVL